jgi:hypothetical protein
MAENKKSFLLYTDVYFTVKKLTDEQAGILFKHILSYVNDENPIIENIIIEIAFEPIKQSLKRDLVKYEEIVKKKITAGKLGGIKSGEIRRIKKEANEANALKTKQNEAKRSKTKQRQANEAVSVSDSVNVNEKEEYFSLAVFEYSNKYPKTMINDFISYWTEKNGSTKKMRFELEKVFEIPKRLATWASKDKTFNKTKFIPEIIPHFDSGPDR